MNPLQLTIINWAVVVVLVTLVAFLLVGIVIFLYKFLSE